MGLWDAVLRALGSKPRSVPEQRTPRKRASLTERDDVDVQESLERARLEVRFREIAIATARSMPEVIDVQEGTDDLTLAVLLREHDEPTVVDLNSVFRRTRDSSPDARREALESFLRSVAQPPRVSEDWNEVRDQLIVVLRAHNYHGVDRSGAPILGIQRSFVSPLDEFVAVRVGEALVYLLSHDQVDRWGKSSDEIFRHARENLAKSAARDDWTNYDEGILLLECQDGLAASRLLLRRSWELLAEHLGGQPVAIVPDQNSVYAAASQDPDAVRRLLEMAEREFAAAERPVSPALYSVTPEIQAFMLDCHNLDERLDHELSLRAAKFVFAEYNRQARNAEQAVALPEAQSDAGQASAFVPSAMFVETGSGYAVSALMMADCDTLMPDVGQAVLMRVSPPEIVTDGAGRILGLRDSAQTTERQTTSYWWPDVKKYFGHRLKAEPGWDPPRYRITPSMIHEIVRECPKMETSSP